MNRGLIMVGLGMVALSLEGEAKFFKKDEIDFWGSEKEVEVEKTVLEEKSTIVKKVPVPEKTESVSPEDHYGWMKTYVNSPFARVTMNSDGTYAIQMPPKAIMEALHSDDPGVKERGVRAYLAMNVDKFSRINSLAPYLKKAAFDMNIIRPEHFVVEKSKDGGKSDEMITNVAFDPGYLSTTVFKRKLVSQDGIRSEGDQRVPGSIENDVLVLYFYKNTCAYCMEFRPKIEAFAKRYGSEVSFKGIYCDNDKSSYIGDVQFRRARGDDIPFKTWMHYYESDGGEYGSYIKDFDVVGTPTVMFMNVKTGKTVKLVDYNDDMVKMVRALEEVKKVDDEEKT